MKFQHRIDLQMKSIAESVKGTPLLGSKQTGRVRGKQRK